MTKKEKRIYSWIVSEAYDIAKDKDDERSRELESYIRNIAPEFIGAWSSTNEN